MPTPIDLDRWNRKAHFDFFKDFENPFFNICADVDLTLTHRYVKAHGLSPFLTTLYLSLRTANEIEPFRYRIQGSRVVAYDHIHAGSTILYDDDTFGFCYFTYHRPFSTFYPEAQATLNAFRQAPKRLEPRPDQDDVVHYSILPWVHFSSFTHARHGGSDDSVPKIVLGKYEQRSGALRLPVSVSVHHALLDGLHVGRYFEHFQRMCRKPAAYLEE